ncbi:O-acyltransferase like protein [Thalassophryne amazonica]|uniref:O-acyltransferase like protein n=1 Tax=Thalassophryne amazonica TaxID=390379 RepID=UPI0014708995|nr:O-acyltransferase like protein [Thalassophryne amazonica]
MALGCAVFLLFAGIAAVLATTYNVSVQCMTDTNTFLWEINQKNPKEYATEMYDAFGKMGSGVIDGNVNQPGMMQQCRRARGPGFSGRYCQVFLKQGTVLYFVGICIPDSCEEDDVQMLVLYEKFQFGQKSLVPPFPPILVNQSAQEIMRTYCMSNTIYPDASDITFLFVLCLMVAVPLAATLFSAIIRWQQNREGSPRADSTFLHTDLNLYGSLKSSGSSSGGMTTSAAQQHSEINCNISEQNVSSRPCFPRSCVFQCLQAFSLQNTTKGVLSTTSSIPGGGYPVLNAIRVLSIFWIASGHTTHFIALHSLDNSKIWRKTVESSPVYVFTSSGPVYLGVDTFLLLGGLLSARSLLASIQRAEDKLSIAIVANYLFNRIKRVQPLHLFIVCLVTGVSSVVQWGPYWYLFRDFCTGCKKDWWANLLLITNLLTEPNMCVPWAWYLSLDFQCYVTTPLLVYLYRLNRRVLTMVSGALLLGTTVASAFVTAVLHLPVFQPFALTHWNYTLYYYMKPYTRYGPFLIGILTGIYLTTKKVQLLQQKWQAALGWFSCLGVLALVVGLPYILQGEPSSPCVLHALYQGLHRQLWVLAVTWIILACEEGYGGWINSFLSSGLWIPLSNMSYAFYLTHPIIIMIYMGLQETPFHYTDINIMYMFLGNLAMSLVVSYVFVVLVEKPFLLLKCGSKLR